MIARTPGSRLAILAMIPLCVLLLGARVPTTQEDFHVPGTEHGEVDISVITTSDNCQGCHGDYDPGIDLYSAWKGSLMSMAAVDPLYFAQLTTANQDTSEAGYYCLRCHAPFGIASGHTIPTDGSALDDQDRDGVTCHICHALTDPIYKPGESPERDLAVLAGTADLPQYYGNGAFVLDPTFTMRGPLDNIYAAHDSVFSPIHESGNHCGTCHDVGNTEISRQPDGTWRYNALNAPAPDPNPRMQFPIQSTYTEWKLSLFPGEGVDMSGRFGDPDEPIIHDCQQCHMPDVVGQACYFGPVRDDLPLHAFAGGGFTMLGVIAAQDPLPQQVDLEAIARGRDARPFDAPARDIVRGGPERRGAEDPDHERNGAQAADRAQRRTPGVAQRALLRAERLAPARVRPLRRGAGGSRRNDHAGVRDPRRAQPVRFDGHRPSARAHLAHDAGRYHPQGQPDPAARLQQCRLRGRGRSGRGPLVRRTASTGTMPGSRSRRGPRGSRRGSTTRFFPATTSRSCATRT